MIKKIKQLEKRIEVLERQAAAGTATAYKKINLKRNGLIKIDNETEGYQFEGPAKIIIVERN